MCLVIPYISDWFLIFYDACTLSSRYSYRVAPGPQGSKDPGDSTSRYKLYSLSFQWSRPEIIMPRAATIGIIPKSGAKLL